jgi:hypothetical protein
MSMTYHDKIVLAPAKREGAKPASRDDYGIGRSPRFASGWWLTVTAIFYAVVALVCIFMLG